MNIKPLVAKFQNDTQSNSVLDFVVWLDCQEELGKEIDKQIRDFQTSPIKRCKNGN